MGCDVSVIMPVFNGAATIERAVKSVLGQTFPGWELICVDDCSTDGSYDLLVAWSQQESRIRLLRCAVNQGAGGARNVGLREATGEFIAYLDCDDEFYPEYLQHVVRFRSKGDVLLFQYDYEIRSEETGVSIQTSDPAVYHNIIFMYNPSVPLGVAHRRDLLEVAGAFDARPWFQEDWDFWKRLARTGATFLFLPFKSGLYHSVPTSQTHSPRLSDRQRTHIEAIRKSRDSLFPHVEGKHRRRAVERIAFAAPYSIIDPSSGAAVATNSAMQLLAKSGFRCEAFGAARLDYEEEMCIEQVLAELALPYDVKKMGVGTAEAKLLFTRIGSVPITIFRNVFSQGGPAPPEAAAFLTAYEKFLEESRPDAVVTYGGDPLEETMLQLTKRRDIAVVFALHNFAYDQTKLFEDVDYVVVPSEFSKEYYRERLGLHCQVLANVIEPERVVVAGRQPQYLTFVNPQPTKGLYVVARIAEQLARHRPDIPILMVEGRGRGKSLEQTGLDLSWAKNLFGMPNTTDPRKFYAVTKVLLMPSLWNESFGLVAAEAMLNGIPVLASNRGALPETVGEGGLLFDIPARYTPATRDVPTAEEVEPWVDAILRLWDDAAFYRQQSELAVRWSERFHPDRLRAKYVDFFSNVHPQAGPPIVLRQGEPS